MDRADDAAMKERLERLEKAVLDLQFTVKHLESKLKTGPPEKPAVSSAPPPPPVTPAEVAQAPKVVAGESFPAQPAAARKTSSGLGFELPEHMKKVEYWLNKVGIALVLFAVAFLFKYSIDKGWLTPWVRVAFGVALGIALVGLGYRTYEKRRHFSLVFLGGGIATFYITAFAAFQRLAIVGYIPAFAFMIAVTLLALALSLKQNDPVLSLIGALGGFGTPFMLYTGSGNIPGLVLYTCILIAATSSMYYYRGWRSLMWVTVASGWTVLIIALLNGVLDVSLPPLIYRQSIQAGLLFALFAFWAVPVLREVTGAGRGSSVLKGSRFGDYVTGQVHWLTVSSPLVALLLSAPIWSGISEAEWGWITMCGAALFWAVSYGLSSKDSLKDLCYTHILTGGLLFTIGLCLILSGDTLFFAIATEATVLHLISRRTKSVLIGWAGHVLFALLAMVLYTRMYYPQNVADPVFNSRALADFWAIATAFGLSYLLRSTTERRIYFLIAYFALAAWLIRELDGNLLFTLITVQALAFHLLTYRGGDAIVRAASHFFSIIVGGWLAVRLIDRQTTASAVTNVYALVNLLTIFVSAGVARLSRESQERLLYALAAHVAFMGWLLCELVTLTDGQGYVTITWGIYGTILLIIGLRRNDNRVRMVALATLLAVVGKLFMVDLSHLEAIFRILLFMGFGAAFLALSYYFRALWKSDSGASSKE